MKRLFHHTRGSVLVDYGILVGLIAVAVIFAITIFGKKVDFIYRVVDQEVWMTFNDEANFLDNGDFDDVEGLTSQNFGFSSGSLEGWVSNNGLRFELHESGHQGMASTNGGYWLDMAESPGVMDISQEVDSLIDGQVYTVTLFSGDRTSQLLNRTLVFWNGNQVGELRAIEPDVMTEKRMSIIAGSGDGSNTLRLVEVASQTNDNTGMSIDVIRIWGR
jgi:Flp pilus assembly pilin Flp